MSSKKVPFDREKAIRKLTKSKAYRLAYKDPDFLDIPYARPSRLQLELLKA